METTTIITHVIMDQNVRIVAAAIAKMKTVGEFVTCNDFLKFKRKS